MVYLGLQLQREMSPIPSEQGEVAVGRHGAGGQVEGLYHQTQAERVHWEW